MAEDAARAMPDAIDETDLADDPFAQFASWFAAAERDHFEPEALALATADGDGRPAVRMVLLKQFDRDGFVFQTNYASRKGRELAGNPRAAMLFHWDPPGRQVRIEGTVSPLTREENTALIQARDPRSRIVSLASEQSRPLASREELARRVEELEARYGDEDLPIPDDWGGYRLVPDAFEFWQQGRNRFHDRFRYTRSADGWAVERLYP
jgi:pyridoxamine 5'-phosphate oxidase